MRTAHIFPIDPKVGEKSLTACGEKRRVKVLFEDLHPETPICHTCVGRLLEGVNDRNDQVADALALAVRTRLLLIEVTRKLGELNAMTEMQALAEEYAEERAAKAEAKAAKKCTCTWAAPTEDAERILSLGCPVHDPERPPIAPETEDQSPQE